MSTERIVTITIRTCCECPYLRRQGWWRLDQRRHPVSPGTLGHFGSGCRRAPRGIDDPDQPVPDWCPLLKVPA